METALRESVSKAKAGDSSRRQSRMWGLSAPEDWAAACAQKKPAKASDAASSRIVVSVCGWSGVLLAGLAECIRVPTCADPG